MGGEVRAVLLLLGLSIKVRVLDAVRTVYITLRKKPPSDFLPVTAMNVQV